MQKIIITLPELNISAEAVLHKNIAPKTVEAFSSILPIEGKALHARWCGNEIWLPLPNLKLESRENQTILPSPGEILLVDHGGTWDLAIFYGKGWLFSPTGFLPSNHFATIEYNQLSEFAKAANQLLIQGSKKITLASI
ncbi:MAG: DUF3830 family protein [Deltaproteobacteria bacterium]|nr:DUF3830 family protein [Deltaproteobacteria bacterium]